MEYSVEDGELEPERLVQDVLEDILDKIASTMDSSAPIADRNSLCVVCKKVIECAQVFKCSTKTINNHDDLNRFLFLFFLSFSFSLFFLSFPLCFPLASGHRQRVQYNAPNSMSRRVHGNSSSPQHTRIARINRGS